MTMGVLNPAPPVLGWVHAHSAIIGHGGLVSSGSRDEHDSPRIKCNGILAAI